ncbi:MAG: hypothetical protein Q8R05_02140 [Candidatus Omnitrophota bacterium]|nr:hypothetical protein [Candidatus Omnitrophota bacterium]
MRRHRGGPLLIIGVAILFILVYIDLEGRVFLEGFKNKSLALIKEKIGLEGEIGDIEGGIFREIVLKDVKLYGAGAAAQPVRQLFFSSSAIELDYRIWDIAFKKFYKLNKITFISPNVYFYDAGNKFAIPKVVEPAWKEITISIRDGSFHNSQAIPVITEFNGNFKLDEKGIESRNVSASIFGQRFFGSGSLGFPLARSVIRLEGAIKGRGYFLKAEISGVIEEMAVRGTFEIPERLNLNFSGNVSATENEVSLKNFNFGDNLLLSGVFESAKKGFRIDLYPQDIGGNAAALGEESHVGIIGDFSKLPYFTLNINATHLKLLGFDLLSNYNINGKLNYGKDGRLDTVVGDFSTSGSLINYDPIRELKGTYEVEGGEIKLLGLNYGDVVFANGFFSSSPPNEIDLNFRFKGAQLAGLTDLTMERGLISGLVFGDIRIYGDLEKKFKINGSLDFLNGNIGIIKYNSAKVTMKGNSERLEFFDSKVYTDDEVLTLEGKMDMKDVGTSRAFRNIVIKSDPNTVVWAGTSVTRVPGGEEYVSGRDISEQFRVNFKTYSAQQIERGRPKQDEVELEYKLGKPGNIKLRMKENDDFFGVERKVRF